MKAKPLAVLAAFVLWSAGSTYWYVCQIKGFCTRTSHKEVKAPPPEAESPTEEQAVVAERELISYDLSDISPKIKDSMEWNRYVQSLALKVKEGKKVQITGPYLSGEPVPEGYENMGLARAESVKALLKDHIPEDKIVTSSRLLDGDLPGGQHFINGFEGYFAWVTDNDYVKEKAGKTLIYFPFNSKREIRNPEILKYLDELVTTLKQNPDARVEITGYTDNIGTPESNKWLGRQRAERIARILMRKGIAKERIIVKSGGQENPVADNATKEGRKLNRRVEIKIIQ